MTNSPLLLMKRVDQRAAWGLELFLSCVHLGGVVEAVVEKETHRDWLMSESGRVSADVFGARMAQLVLNAPR